MIYNTIYFNLCQRGKFRKKDWKPKSNIHKHHIIPKHNNGKDIEENYTYLTIREHIIAHFLLWKIYKNPNDLRSMKMLGAKLTYTYRKTIGEYCRDNKIGFFSDLYKNDRKKWAKKGLDTQEKNNNKNSFYYWSTEKGRKERASLGGKKGTKTQIKNKIGIFDISKKSEYASIGGKSLKGMICVTNGTHRTRIKPEKLEEYLNKGYKRGFKLSP